MQGIEQNAVGSSIPNLMATGGSAINYYVGTPGGSAVPAETRRLPHFDLVGLGYPRPLYVSPSHQEGVVEPTTADHHDGAVLGMTLKFQNTPTDQSLRAMNVVAQLRFYSENWSKSLDIDYGVWVDSGCNCTDMEVGDRRELILLVLDGEDRYAIGDLRHDLNKSYDRYVREFPVNWFQNLKVTLIDQNSHASRHWFLRIWHNGGWCHGPVTPPATVK